MRLALGIASVGRPEILQTTVDRLSRQRRAADRTILSLASDADVADAARLRRQGVEIVTGLRGLTRQRNAILDAAGDCDVVVFFDDDFVPCEDYLANAETLMQSRNDVALATGAVLADGIGGPGLSFSDAFDLVGAKARPDAAAVTSTYNGYGCNMVVRASAARRNGVRFDERLPLYGWLEDVDFSRRLAKHGAIVHAGTLRGVHLGVKRGRQSGVRLGYSQIANPLYLMRKRSMRGDRALALIGRNLAMNLVKSMRPEPYVDRRGRLIGNLTGLRDLLGLRLHPERVLEM